MEKKYKIIYIAGYGRSGSTLLDIVLSNSENGFTLGEISNVFNEKIEITDDFYANILIQTVENLKLTDLEIKKVKSSDKFFYDYSSKYRDFWETFFSKLIEENLLTFLVDSSKTTWDTLFRPYNLHKSGFNVCIVFLKASYIKVWKSALKGSNKYLQNEVASNKRHYLFAVKSVISKLLIDVLTKIIYDNVRFNIINLNYEEFVDDPLKSIEYISDKFEIDFIDLNSRVKQNEFVIKGGYLGNRLRKKDAYIRIRKSV